MQNESHNHAEPNLQSQENADQIIGETVSIGIIITGLAVITYVLTPAFS